MKKKQQSNLISIVFINYSYNIVSQYSLRIQTVAMIDSWEELDYHIYKGFTVLAKIGKGSYGQVFKVRDRHSGETLALKKIVDAFQNLTDAKRTYRQLNYLLQITHPSIVKFIGLVGDTARQSYTAREDIDTRQKQQSIGCTTDKLCLAYPQRQKHVYALFEYLPMDLSAAIRRCSSLSPIHRKFIAYQLLSAVSYLHSSKLIHRDIKPSNILLDPHDVTVKLCDFGLCKLKDKQQNQNDGIETGYVAARWYRAPEVLLGGGGLEAGDLWAVGCVMAQLITGNPIFQGNSTIDQLQKIFQVIGLPSASQISALQCQSAQYLLKTFTFSRKCQMRSLSQVLCQGNSQQLKVIASLLQFQASNRPSAVQSLRSSYFDEIREMGIDYEKDGSNRGVQIGEGPGGRSIDRVLWQDGRKCKFSLQQYRQMIQQLEKATRRSTLRSNTSGNASIGAHKQLYKKENLDYHKEKSTRQSNFLSMHKPTMFPPPPTLPLSNRSPPNQIDVYSEQPQNKLKIKEERGSVASCMQEKAEIQKTRAVSKGKNKKSMEKIKIKTGVSTKKKEAVSVHKDKVYTSSFDNINKLKKTISTMLHPPKPNSNKPHIRHDSHSILSNYSSKSVSKTVHIATKPCNFIDQNSQKYLKVDKGQPKLGKCKARGKIPNFKK